MKIAIFYMYFVVKTIRKMDEAGAQAIVEMKEEMRKKRLEKRHREAKSEKKK